MCNLPKKILSGTVNVSVGFVDLGSLIWSDVEGDKPTQWIGYEGTPFCVAKTMVIAEMLKNASSVESIVQVWFSSIWKNATFTSFLHSLKTVIENFYHEPQDFVANTLSSQVIKILTHWSMHTNVSPSLAYKLWLEAQTKTVFTSNLLRKEDRLAAGRYMVTGDLLGGTAGSIVMFANPACALALNLNFLATVNFELLIEEWKKKPSERYCLSRLEPCLRTHFKNRFSGGDWEIEN